MRSCSGNIAGTSMESNLSFPDLLGVHLLRNRMTVLGASSFSMGDTNKSTTLVLLDLTTLAAVVTVYAPKDSRVTTERRTNHRTRIVHVILARHRTQARDTRNEAWLSYLDRVIADLDPLARKVGGEAARLGGTSTGARRERSALNQKPRLQRAARQKCGKNTTNRLLEKVC